jgi:hypothetical protein
VDSVPPDEARVQFSFGNFVTLRGGKYYFLSSMTFSEWLAWT